MSELRRMPVARITGALYLGFILASVIADLLAHLGIGGADEMWLAITTTPGSFRLGLVVALVSTLLFVVSAWGLFVLLRPVNRDLALLFLLLNAIGVAIQCASIIALVSALVIGDGAASGTLTEPQQVAAASIAISTYKTGFVTAQLFFSTWLFPLGYLVFRSGFLPRFLGILLLVDGVGVLIWFLQALLLPAYPAISYPGLIVSFAAEAGLGLWLLIMGVKDRSEVTA